MRDWLIAVGILGALSLVLLPQSHFEPFQARWYANIGDIPLVVKGRVLDSEQIRIVLGASLLAAFGFLLAVSIANPTRSNLFGLASVVLAGVLAVGDPAKASLLLNMSLRGFMGALNAVFPFLGEQSLVSANISAMAHLAALVTLVRLLRRCLKLADQRVRKTSLRRPSELLSK